MLTTPEQIVLWISSLSAEFPHTNHPQRSRFVRLNQTAIRQFQSLTQARAV